MNRSTESVYDLAGRLTVSEEIASDGSTVLTTTTFGYDAAGNQTTVTSPRGNEGGATPADFTTTIGYDALNRVISVTQPVTALDSIATSYAYDAAGNNTRLTNGEGAVTEITYQAWNLQEDYVEASTAAHPLLVERTFTTVFDAGGLPVEERQPGGVTVVRVYDELGRVSTSTGTSTAGEPTGTRTYDYDAAGFRTDVSHPSGTILYTFDDRGLLRTVAGPAGAATYSYDPAGRLTQRTDGAGTHDFGWTVRSELDTATEGLGSTTIDYTWDVAGQLDLVTYGAGGPTRDYVYDDRGLLTLDRLEDSVGGLMSEAVFEYDVDANLITQDITLSANPETGTNSYLYDNSGRLSSWTHNAAVTDVVWDDAGNRTGFGADTYSHDERNRLLSGPEGTYTYTPRGTIETLDDGVTTTTYVFDGLSRMASYSDGTTTVAYTYDGLDRIATRDSDSFTYVGTSLDPTSDGTYTWARSPGGRLLSQSEGVTSLLAGVDRHGDLTHLFTAAGVVSDTALFDPFGDEIGASGTTGSTLGFQSDYTDPASEHVWMGARWYDGGWAAFLSRDTVFGELATPISLNRYTYGFANPMSFWDPDGRLSQRIIADEISASEQIKEVRLKAKQREEVARLLALNDAAGPESGLLLTRETIGIAQDRAAASDGWAGIGELLDSVVEAAEDVPISVAGVTLITVSSETLKPLAQELADSLPESLEYLESLGVKPSQLLPQNYPSREAYQAALAEVIDDVAGQTRRTTEAISRTSITSTGIRRASNALGAVAIAADVYFTYAGNVEDLRVEGHPDPEAEAASITLGRVGTGVAAGAYCAPFGAALGPIGVGAAAGSCGLAGTIFGSKFVEGTAEFRADAKDYAYNEGFDRYFEFGGFLYDLFSNGPLTATTPIGP